MTTLERNFDEQFNKFVGYSIAFHIALVGALYLKNKVFFNNDEVLIKNAIQVDVVALPDKVKPKAKPVPKPKKPKVNLKPKKKPKTTKKDQSMALQKLNAMAAIEKLKQKQKEEDAKRKLEEAKKELERQEQEQLKKGNKVTDPGALSGIERLKMKEFYRQIQMKMHENFLIPAFLQDKGYNAKVLLKADASGNIIFREIYESSGNEIFDDAVLTSVDNASPVAPPPKVLQRRIEYEGIILGFPQ